jgi:uncharacterized phage protein (TIGR01671 family)
MKREIKFRAVCSISKELVYGDLINGVGAKKGKSYILPNTINLAYVKHSHPLDGVNVIPETVSQFTDLTDKHGKEIYEGDILKQRYYPLGSDKKVMEYYKLGVVIYNNASYGLQLKFEGTNVLDEAKKLSHHRTIKKVYKHPSAGENWVDKSFYGEFEIIGNIYENPELL